MGFEVQTISVREAAKILGISHTTAYEAAHGGLLPVLKFGRTIRVVKVGLDRMLDQAARGAKAA